MKDKPVNDKPLKITSAPYKDEKDILQVPTNQGHLTIVVCAARARINPKTLYFRLVRTKDAWMRDDVLDKKQKKSGGGYKDESAIKEMCKELNPRKGIETFKTGSWEAKNL
jgi:hypothetical protein